MKKLKFLLYLAACVLTFCGLTAQAKDKDDREGIVVIAGTSMTSADLEEFLKETPVGTASTLQRHQDLRQFVRHAALVFITVPAPGKPPSRGDKAMFWFNPRSRDKGMFNELESWVKHSGFMPHTLREELKVEWPELGRVAEIRLYTVRPVPR